MHDREVSAGCVIAWSLWALSIGTWISAWFLGEEIGRLSLIVCGAAVTATVRSYFVGQEERIKAAMTVTSVVTRDSVSTLPRRR